VYSDHFGQLGEYLFGFVAEPVHDVADLRFRFAEAGNVEASSETIEQFRLHFVAGGSVVVADRVCELLVGGQDVFSHVLLLSGTGNARLQVQTSVGSGEGGVGQVNEATAIDSSSCRPMNSVYAGGIASANSWRVIQSMPIAAGHSWTPPPLP
jgi:hypothetical protein